MAGGEVNRSFEFFNQASHRPVCDKEFKSLPDQVRVTMLTRIEAWKKGEDLGKGLSPFTESRNSGLWAFKYRWRGGTYRIVFLNDNGRGVALKVFEKKSKTGKKTPPKIVSAIDDRFRIYRESQSGSS